MEEKALGCMKIYLQNTDAPDLSLLKIPSLFIHKDLRTIPDSRKTTRNDTIIRNDQGNSCVDNIEVLVHKAIQTSSKVRG